MSSHYVWTLALRLRPDAPESFLAELRFHLGLTDWLPDEPVLPYDWPCLVAESDDALPGGGIRSLVVQQPYLEQPGSLGLLVRTLVLDDAMYELMQSVPAWLAPWSLTQGWIGDAREEFDLHTWLCFYVQSGHAYAAQPGKTIKPLSDGAPAFVLRETTDFPEPTDGAGPWSLGTRHT
ncbi:hypothetical protein ACI2K4_09790 [Micromonospora sp. NPDC050397]|uniref:hypothetical protein n=1 Tax=Micromonospora sp. NPDC050397 TaxID=3364279 RepID=UPI00384B41F9